MSRPSKKDIKAAVDKLKAKPEGSGDTPKDNEQPAGKTSDKKSSQRIRKGRV